MASLAAGLSILCLSGCTLDPITQTEAGYAMYPNPGKSYNYALSWMVLPTFSCLPKANSTERWVTAIDGIPGAANQTASAQVGVIMGCKNGVPSYVPFYGIYQPGKPSPDRSFPPVRLYANDMISIAIAAGPPMDGQVEFQMGLSYVPGEPVRPPWGNDVRLSAPQITGSAVGCFMQAPAGTYALPKATAIEVYGCEARTDWSLAGMFWAPHPTNQAIRAFKVTTRSGKPLTSLLDQGHNIFAILER